MSRTALCWVAGACELPLRSAPDKSIACLHAEAAAGALADAGLTVADVDGYCCGPDAPGTGPLSLADYLGLRPRYYDTTNVSGASAIVHVAHAAQAIAAGDCSVVLITMAGRPRQEGFGKGFVPRRDDPRQPDFEWEQPFGQQILNAYGMTAMRHMHQFGTTREQLAWVRVAASHHAQHNPLAVYREVVDVAAVLGSPLVADPLRRLDCCAVTDGGGALVVVREDIARALGAAARSRPMVKVIGYGHALWGQNGGWFDLTETAARKSGAAAFAHAGLRPSDIRYASLYDSFTITVLLQIEDLGFCEKGEAGAFVEDGGLIAGVGRLPVNTDGGGLCNNHPANRGGMIKMVEAIRQIRGEAHPSVQVRDCDVALANAIGGQLGVRHASASIIFERA